MNWIIYVVFLHAVLYSCRILKGTREYLLMKWFRCWLVVLQQVGPYAMVYVYRHTELRETKYSASSFMNYYCIRLCISPFNKVIRRKFSSYESFTTCSSFPLSRIGYQEIQTDRLAGSRIRIKNVGAWRRRGCCMYGTFCAAIDLELMLSFWEVII